VKKLVLIVAISAMTLGVGGTAIAQTENTTSPEVTPAAGEDQSALPCDVSLFRQEQQELVQSGYPTSVSERARECEQLGFVNPYPAPALLGPDNVVYPYDPIEGQYYYIDPDTGLYYILDPASDTVSTYDPVSGTFL
jgi:hypothetical protein